MSSGVHFYEHAVNMHERAVNSRECEKYPSCRIKFCQCIVKAVNFQAAPVFLDTVHIQVGYEGLEKQTQEGQFQAFSVRRLLLEGVSIHILSALN